MDARDFEHSCRWLDRLDAEESVDGKVGGNPKIRTEHIGKTVLI